MVEILGKARPDDDIVSPFESEAHVREEVNKRTHKAGYTSPSGGPRYTGNIRSYAYSEQARKNYDLIDWSIKE